MVFDVTQLSRVVYLSGGYSEYKLHRGDSSGIFGAGNLPNGSNEYDEYTLYLFPTYNNNEDTKQAGRNQYLSAYYGGRRLTDVLVVDSLPDSRNYPDGVLYVQLSEKDSKKYVSKLHYRYPNSLTSSDTITYKGHGVKSFTLDQDLGVLHLEFFDDICDVPVLNSQGRLSTKILNNFVDDVKNYTKDHSEAIWYKF